MARILVIDDDEVTRAGLMALLGTAGYQVQVAADGSAAMRLLQGQPADLILCDLFMPGQDGLETIRRLRREMPAVKVVAMSGGGFHGALNLLDVAVKLGACTSLAKPLDAETVLAVIGSTLAGPISG